MVSRKNIKYKQQQEAKQVLHYGIRKLSIGVASVLLGTVFYMQNGTVHADVNPTVNTGNDSVKVVNKNSGTSGSTGASSASIGADSASSVVSTGDTSNLMVLRQASGSPAEGATKQVNNAAGVFSEPGSVASAGQVNAGADKVNVVSSLSPLPNRQTNATENSSDHQLFSNLSLSVNQNSNFNFSSLLSSKVALTGVAANVANGGFDEATWGTLDVNAWKGSVQGDYYQLTDYTGDANHVIVPNAADFAKAGISTNGKQVGVTSDLMKSIRNFIYNDDLSIGSDDSQTVAFSKTGNKQIKALNSDWSNTWSNSDYDKTGNVRKIIQFDGSSLDVSSVTNMRNMFGYVGNIDLSSLSNWDVSNVTDMGSMFQHTGSIDISHLANWDVSKVTNMNSMFAMDLIDDLSPLANWNVSKVTDMRAMFGHDL